MRHAPDRHHALACVEALRPHVAGIDAEPEQVGAAGTGIVADLVEQALPKAAPDRIGADVESLQFDRLPCRDRCDAWAPLHEAEQGVAAGGDREGRSRVVEPGCDGGVGQDSVAMDADARGLVLDSDPRKITANGMVQSSRPTNPPQE